MKIMPEKEKRHALVVFFLGAFVLSAVEYFRVGGFFTQEYEGTDERTVYFSSLESLEHFFTEQEYSLKAWQELSQPVPRLELSSIPTSWGRDVAPSLTVQKKKSIFLMLAIPLVMISNEELNKVRARLLKLDADRIERGTGLWLEELATTYRLASDLTGEQRLKKLIERIDAVPVSIAVAQMIEESGWGTSRFATEGNALYGQWTYQGGLKPLQQREEKGDYRIRVFDTPLDSVRAYMLNLNTNPAYGNFRRSRTVLRQEGKDLSGTGLIRTLTAYSERGEEYISSLKSIIRVNNLERLDRAVLQPKPLYQLKPTAISG